MRLSMIGAALAAAFAFLCAPLAHADNYPVKDGTGVTRTFPSKLSGGVDYPMNVGGGLNGSTPTPFQSDGSGNLKVNCATGCTGGAGGTQYTEDSVHVSGDTGTLSLGVRKDTAASLAGADGDYTAPIFTATGRLWASATVDSALPAGSNTIGGVYGFAGICTTTITRPADTIAYAAGDTWANSTSAPTTGGYTCSNAARISGGSGLITGATIVGSVDASTDLQGEIVVYDSAVTAINDNAAFAPSDTDAVKLVCRIPFILSTGDTNNSAAQLDGLNCPFTASGSADLRFLVKVLNAYTPTSAETLTVRLKFLQTN